jgi:hypothetical protein
MTAATRMSAVMDQLVAGARSSRDAVVNTLDAIERKSRATSAALVRQAEEICVERPKQPILAAPQPATATERDTRFDPEDEWDAAPEAVVNGAAASNTPVRKADPGADDASDDGIPETWLR